MGKGGFVAEEKFLIYTKHMTKLFSSLPAKKGFTLIELLVVVLIIGILSAIALPQYQVAVAKSRLATVMATTRALKNGQEMLFLANGAYEDSLENMGGALPGGCTDQGGGQAVCGKTKYDVGYMDVLGDVAGFTDINGFLMYYDNPTEHPDRAGQTECLALEDDKTAEQVCKSYGGSKLGSFDSWVGTFDRYSMP